MIRRMGCVLVLWGRVWRGGSPEKRVVVPTAASVDEAC